MKSLGTGKKAVIYCRVSTDEQEKEGYSLRNQEEKAQQYARQHGFEVIKVYSGSESAAKPGRPRFSEMLRLILDQQKAKVSKQRCQAILVWHTDRLYRNDQDKLAIQGLGVELHLISEGITMPPQPNSSQYLQHAIQAAFATYFSKQLGEKTKVAMLRKAEEGLYPSRAPIGYLNREDGRTRIIAPDPVLGPKVTRLFELAAKGTHSLAQLSAMAREMELRRDGRRYLPFNHIHKILRNPVYQGEVNWGGIRTQGIHEPIVSRELFKSVQDALDGRTNHASTPRSKIWQFQGLLHCGYCGCMLTVEQKKGKYIYYHCTGNNGPCRKPYISEARLDQMISGLVQSAFVHDPNLVELLREWLRKDAFEKQSERRELVSSTRKEHDHLQTRIDKLFAEKLDGKIDEETFQRYRDQWSSRQRDLLQRMELYRTESLKYLDDGIRLIELAKRSATLYSSASMAEKREMVQLMCSNLKFYENQLEPVFRKPFDSLVVMSEFAEKKKAAFLAKSGIPSTWRPQGDSNPCRRRERAVS